MISHVWLQRISASSWSLPVDSLFPPSALASYFNLWAWLYHPLHCAIRYPPSARSGRLTLSVVVHNPPACYTAKLRVLTSAFSLAGRGVAGCTSRPAPAHAGGRVCVDLSAHCICDAWHRHPCSDSAGYRTSPVESKFRLFLACMQSVLLFSGLCVGCSQANGDIYADLLNDDRVPDVCARFMLSYLTPLLDARRPM